MDIENRTSFVFTLRQEQIDKLRSVLDAEGWEFSAPDHSQWKAVRGKLNIVAYRSCKVTVQGKGAGEFVLYKLEPEILGELVADYSPLTVEEGFSPHAGVDESGKGDFFGPLVVSAVYLDGAMAKQLKLAGVRDSKEIKSSARIAALASKIRIATGGGYAVVAIGNEAYNRLYDRIRNLNRLLAWGHARAIENIVEKVPSCKEALSDKFGSEHLIRNALKNMQKASGIRLVQKTKAESDPAVAAASILARDEFLRRMKRLEEELGIPLPRGAGEAVEKAAARILEKHGVDRLGQVAKKHFKTFAKVTGAELQAELPEEEVVD